MAKLIVKAFARTDWETAITGFDGLSLLQTWEYGETKMQTEPWQLERGVLLDGDKVIGACQALVKRLPIVGGGLVWVNRGPLFVTGDGNDGGDRLATILIALRQYYVQSRGMYLRVAPPLGNEMFDPEQARQAGYTVTKTLGWASAVIDLSSDEDTLRKGLHGKWRSSLNQSERAGIDIREGCSDDLLGAFLHGHRKMLAETGTGAGIATDFLGALQANLPAKRKFEVFLAGSGGNPLGGTLIVRYGNTCEYLAGHLTEEGRRQNAGQALLWRALCRMKEQNCRQFDLGGMDPERTPSGIYRFKERVGGIEYRLAPELEAGGDGLIGSCVRWRVGRARAEA